MVNVDYCKLLAHIFLKSGYCGKQIMHLNIKKVVIDFGGTLFLRHLRLFCLLSR